MPRLALRIGLLAVLWVLCSFTHAHGLDALRTVAVKVETDEGRTYHFRSVSGLGVEVEVVEFRDGGETVVRKLPGRVKYPNLVLKRSYVDSDGIFEWVEAVRQGQADKRDLTITLLDRRGTSLAQFRVHAGFPAGWSVSSGESPGNAVATEELVIAHEGFLKVP
jgi:phage tail-like protein